MRNRLSIFTLLAVLLGLGTGGAVAEELALGSPLLQLNGHGIETTTYFLPFCGVACTGLSPTFVSHQITVGTDGLLTAVQVRNRLGDAQRAESSMAAGVGSLRLFQHLKQSLAQAPIDLAQGGCQVATSEFFTSDDGARGVRYLPLTAELTWFGRGDRRRILDLPLAAEPCPPELAQIVERIFRYRQTVAAQ